MNFRQFVLVVTCAAVTLIPTLTWAGGYYLLPRGARSLGRGGASVASVDDLGATWINPARLASLRGVHVIGDVGIGVWHLEFQRATDTAVDPNGFDTAKNIAPPGMSPSLHLGWDFGLDWFYVSLGFYGPYAGDLGFDSMAPTRYTLVYLDMFQAIYHLDIAFRPVSWLSIGAALQIQDVRMVQAVKLSGYTGFEPLGAAENPTHDILVEIDVANHFNPSALLGIWAAPANWIDIGIALQLPLSIKADGTVRAWLPTDNALLRGAWVDGNQVTVHLNTATVLRAGIGFRLPHRIEVEVDAWAEFWEPHRSLVAQIHDVVLRDIEGGMDLAFGDIAIDQSWESAYGAALGIEWEALVDWLSVRIGFSYDSGAIPDQTVSVAWFDSHKLGLFFGLTVELWRFAFDLGYGHIFFVPRTIEDSVVTQINPLQPAEENLPTVVGNGEYESSIDVLALTLRAQFDTPRWGRSTRTSGENAEENLAEEDLPEENFAEETLAEEAPAEEAPAEEAPAEEAPAEEALAEEIIDYDFSE